MWQLKRFSEPGHRQQLAAAMVDKMAVLATVLNFMEAEIERPSPAYRNDFVARGNHGR